jgi:uncharacterized protein
MLLPDLGPLGWTCVLSAAVSAGIAKTGVPGLGILSVPLMAQAIDPKQATGALLPVLMCADILAILTYRTGADWKQIGRLLTWAVPGIVLGTFLLKRIEPKAMLPLLGWLLLALIGLAMLRRAGKLGDVEKGLPAWLAPPAGLLGGFTTMVANAAGPVMNLYLLAMRLPKEVFLPTAAWFFFLINWIKVPFAAYAGVLDLRSLTFSVTLFPAALLGGVIGRTIAKKIDQKLFETLAWAFTIAAAIKFLFTR